MENKNITVLVTDDEDDFRRLMVFWLKSKGYLVIDTDSGEKAIELVKLKNPDILFMDLRMPNMDGPQAIKKIREFNQDVPVIIISAYLDDAKIGEASSLGISGIFYKGKDFTQGLSLLESVLRTHKKLKNKILNQNKEQCP